MLEAIVYCEVIFIIIYFNYYCFHHKNNVDILFLISKICQGNFYKLRLNIFLINFKINYIHAQANTEKITLHDFHLDWNPKG